MYSPAKLYETNLKISRKKGTCFKHLTLLMLSFHLTNIADVPNLYLTTPYPRYTEVKQRSNLQDSAEDPQGIFFIYLPLFFPGTVQPPPVNHICFFPLSRSLVLNIVLRSHAASTNPSYHAELSPVTH